MFRHYSQALLIALTCSCLAIAISPARIAFAATDDGSIAAKSDAQIENPATKIATPSVPEKRAGVSDAATEAEQKENAHILKRRAGEQSIAFTREFEAVGFNIPVAEFTSTRGLTRHRELRALGPDLLSEEFNTAHALSRIRDRETSSIADALLNQRLLAGLGNVYKSEVLFMCRVNPFALVRNLSDEDLTAIIDTGRRVLRANVATQLAPMTTYPGLRRTTGRAGPTERVWVYGRARLPCRRCATPIRVRKQGLDARLTYWCPACQPALSTGD